MSIWNLIQTNLLNVFRVVAVGVLFMALVAPQAQADVAEDKMFGADDSFFQAKPIPDAELAKLRGGFVFPNGMVMNFELRFFTESPQINGGVPVETILTEADLTSGATGVVNNVNLDNGTANVEFTSDVSGIMTNITNNVNGAELNNNTTLSLELQNAPTMSVTHTTNMIVRSITGLGL